LSNTSATSIRESSEGFSPPTSIFKRWRRRRFLWAPLVACLLITVIARVWLTIHTHGVISGDEALVGIQAEHILQGEHPIYYYSQPYMGSLEAYFLAFIFLFTGPSVWAMRAEPMLLSLVLIYLTWRFSAALADAAQLPPRTKILFMTIATLVAALPPLYDMIEEMRAKGGYTEAITIMLWMLLCAFRLTQRWREGASARELALRWAGIGFLVGLGLWVDAIVVYAILTIALWIGGYVLLAFVKPGRQTATQPRVTLLKQALLVVVALPASLVGFAPGLYWGAQNQWANIRYLFQNGGSVSQNRLHTIMQVQQIYSTCLAPRVLGGALPTQPGVTAANPYILTFGLVVSVCCIALIATSIFLSAFWHHPVLVCLRQLTLLPLLFIVCASIIFCASSISAVALSGGCSFLDPAGRYVVPLVIVLPFLLAAVFTLPALLMQEKETTPTQEREAMQDVSPFSTRSTTTLSPLLVAIQAGLLTVLLIYFCFQGVAYKQADPRNTFQQYGCASENPTDLDPIIAYMQEEHIRYAWANGWLGFPIMFKTNSAILVPWLYHRIPGIGTTVLQADRPSFFILAKHDDLHPAILHVLDTNNVTYHVERFYSEPGVDALLVTPLNRTVSALDPAFAALFNSVFYYNCS
jgi:hypothetical protein